MSEKRTQSQIGKSNVERSKSHERKVAALLTSWSGVNFCRRKATGRDHNTMMLNMTGDVVCVDKKINFNLEAKTGDDFSFTSLCSNPTTNTFCRWYHQSSYDAILSTATFGRTHYPMVFFRPTISLNWIAISIPGFETLTAKNGNLYDFPHLKYELYDSIGEITHNVSHTHNKKNKVMIPLQLKGCVICSWNNFQDHIDPGSLFYGE